MKTGKLRKKLYFLSDEKYESDKKILKENNIQWREILRYAEKMGERWDVELILKSQKRFRFLNNFAASLYDIKYQSLSRNISEEDAKFLIDKFKKDKATSKDGFIKRHGKIKGLKKLKKFIKTSKAPELKLKRELKIKYGIEWKKKHIEIKRTRTKRCPEYYLNRGIAKNEEEAKKLVSEYQKSTSGVHREYYINKGYSDFEIDEFLKIILIKKSHHSRNRKFLKQKYGTSWKIHYEKTSKKYRKYLENNGTWIKLKDLSKWVKYSRKVRCLTDENLLFNKIDDIEKRSKSWHLDHIFSIKHGFINKVPPEIIASPVNLRIIDNLRNSSKKEKSDISLEELNEKYIKWKSLKESESL